MKKYQAKIISKKASEKHTGGSYEKTVREYSTSTYHYLTGTVPVKVREYTKETISFTDYFLKGTYEVPELNKQFKYFWQNVVDFKKIKDDITVVFDQGKPKLIQINNPYPIVVNEKVIWNKMVPKFWLVLLFYIVGGYIQFGINSAFSDAIKEFNFFKVDLFNAHYLSQTTIYLTKIITSTFMLGLPFLYSWKMYVAKKKFKEMVKLLNGQKVTLSANKKGFDVPDILHAAHYSKLTTKQFWFWWCLVLATQIYGNFDFNKYQRFYDQYDTEATFFNNLNQQYNLPNNQDLKSRITTIPPQNWLDNTLIDYEIFSLKNQSPVLFIIKIDSTLQLESEGCTLAEFIGYSANREKLFVIGNSPQNHSCIFSAKMSVKEMKSFKKNLSSQLVTILPFQTGIGLKK